jgi:light-regulated signal transduction histidine kinase (bacteriophytochrome)
VGISRDITNEKLVQERLAQQAQELTRSNKELEQFAYVASHDLQEPLRMVASYTQLLARRYQGKLDATADEFIHFAVDGATRMQCLINDLLSYSRVGSSHHEPVAVSCDAVIDQALANLRGAISESGAAIERGPLPQVRGDRTQLVQLFQNLIGNAIKFHGAAPPKIQIEAQLSSGPCSIGGAPAAQCRLAVKDNGIGIDPQYAERIFVIFQRLHGVCEYPGTGIGLAICKKIVERHGGRIWLESRPGQGATFYFTIPQIQEDPI